VFEEFFPRETDGDRRIPTVVDSVVEHIRSIGDNPSAGAGETRPDFLRRIVITSRRAAVER
jgi:hypothetical protein